MRIIILVLTFCSCFLSSCSHTNTDHITLNDPKTSVSSQPSVVTEVKTDDPVETVEPKYIDEARFKDVELKWVKLINQDVKAVAENDIRTFAALRNLNPEPSLLPTTPIASVEFMDVVERTDNTGSVQVDYRFLGALQEPQIATYKFEWKVDKWIIIEVSINASYIPVPKGILEPKYIDETNYSGEQLKWVKLLNEDVKAIAEADEAAFDSLRQSEQSIPADIPQTPVASIELLEVLDQSANRVKILVDRRKWGIDEPTYMNYLLVYDHEKWMIADVD